MPKFMNLYKVMNEADEHGADGGSGGNQASIEDLQAQLADLSGQLEKVNAKNQELLGEKKKAKQAADEAARAEAAAKEEAARKAGDFEQLHKSALQELDTLKQQLSDRDKRDAENAVSKSAMKIAMQLADGNNAEMLSRFISDRLKFSDGEVKVTDKDGQLTISSLDDLQKEFANDARYNALLKGNQSSGSGAAGGKNSGGAAKVITRAEFDAKSHVERQKFFADGGKLTD